MLRRNGEQSGESVKALITHPQPHPLAANSNQEAYVHDCDFRGRG